MDKLRDTTNMSDSINIASEIGKNICTGCKKRGNVK
jgi:hypothetical protein